MWKRRKSFDQVRTWWGYRCGYLSSVNIPVSGIYDALGCSHLLKPTPFLAETPADPPVSLKDSVWKGRSVKCHRTRTSRSTKQLEEGTKVHQRSNIPKHLECVGMQTVQNMSQSLIFCYSKGHLHYRHINISAAKSDHSNSQLFGLGASASCWFHILLAFKLSSDGTKRTGSWKRTWKRKDMNANISKYRQFLAGLGHTLLFSSPIHLLISPDKAWEEPSAWSIYQYVMFLLQIAQLRECLVVFKLVTHVHQLPNSVCPVLGFLFFHFHFLRLHGPPELPQSLHRSSWTYADGCRPSAAGPLVLPAQGWKWSRFLGQTSSPTPRQKVQQPPRLWALSMQIMWIPGTQKPMQIET